MNYNYNSTNDRLSRKIIIPLMDYNNQKFILHPYSKAIVLKVVCPLTELRNLHDGFGAGRYLMGRKGQSDEGF